MKEKRERGKMEMMDEQVLHPRFLTCPFFPFSHFSLFPLLHRTSFGQTVADSPRAGQKCRFPLF